MMKKILVLNAGSSTLKYQLFNVDGDNYDVVAKGNAERINRDASFVSIKHGNEGKQVDVVMSSHKDALDAVLKLLLETVISDLGEISAIGQRVVQGGAYFKESVLATEDNIKRVDEYSSLAPLHNPAAVMVIRAAQEILPNVKQVLVFDTAFHQTMPYEAYTYALPEEQITKYKIRRYGFHGTSHKYVSEQAIKFVGENSKIITCHIGSGASITAIKNGKCVDTSMGMTPLAGMVMDTRTGDIDPYIPLYIIKTQGLTPDQVSDMLNKESGKAGLTGYSDSRDFQAAYERGEPKAINGMEVFIYSIVKFIGSYTAAMGGLDAIVFTAGVGENSSLVRKLVLDRLAYMGIDLDEEKNEQRGFINEISKPGSKVRAFVIPTDEELVIAQDTVKLI
ncbi:MAG: acetate kinase [Lactobacillus sp.]|nr:acetate kinase [Lactobacillus sp.]